jgi:tRNA (guanosine-2'-O-)-methyltransferase
MQEHPHTKIIEQFSAQRVIDSIQDFVTAQRKERIDTVLSGRLQSIELAIEAPSDINNALAAIRTCEALGVATVHLIATEGDAKAVKPITQGAFYWVNIVYHDSLAQFLASKPNLALAGGTIGAQQPLATLPVDKPLCIMIGNEQRGLSTACIDALDYQYSIPMFGMSESYNLSVSAAISLYDTTQRKRAELGTRGDLTDSQYQHAKAKYYLRSINPRIVRTLFSEKKVVGDNK